MIITISLLLNHATAATAFSNEVLYVGPVNRDPKKHISKSILKGCPYLNGLHYKGVYMGYPYPNFCLCGFLGGPGQKIAEVTRHRRQSRLHKCLEHRMLATSWLDRTDCVLGFRVHRLSSTAFRVFNTVVWGCVMRGRIRVLQGILHSS